jgi:hypothetical protein
MRAVLVRAPVDFRMTQDHTMDVSGVESDSGEPSVVVWGHEEAAQILEGCLGMNLPSIQELMSMLMQASESPYHCSSVGEQARYLAEYVRDMLEGSGFEIPDELRLERVIAANGILESVWGLSHVVIASASKDEPIRVEVLVRTVAEKLGIDDLDRVRDKVRQCLASEHCRDLLQRDGKHVQRRKERRALRVDSASMPFFPFLPEEGAVDREDIYKWCAEKRGEQPNERLNEFLDRSIALAVEAGFVQLAGANGEKVARKRVPFTRAEGYLDVHHPDAPHLVVEADVLAQALEDLREATSHGTQVESIVTFQDQRVIFSCFGEDTSIPATGEWPGEARVGMPFLRSVSPALPGRESVTMYVDLGRFHIGKSSTKCVWQEAGGRVIRLSEEPSPRDALRLLRSHTRDQIEASGLDAVVRTAERDRDEMSLRATQSLRSLGVTSDDVHALVEGVVHAEEHRSP